MKVADFDVLENGEKEGKISLRGIEGYVAGFYASDLQR